MSEKIPQVTYTQTAYGKINTHLTILGMDESTGLHRIETTLVRLDVGARVRLSLELRQNEASPLWHTEHQMAAKAIDLFFKTTAPLTNHLFARVDVTDELPFGAGLGGGSSVAATVLRLLLKGARDLGVKLPQRLDMMKLAFALGCDVPFFFSGLPAAHATGYGEVLTPAEFHPCRVVVAIPEYKMFSASSYTEADRLGVNDFAQLPQNRAFADTLSRITGTHWHLSGKGGAHWAELDGELEQRLVTLASTGGFPLPNRCSIPLSIGRIELLTAIAG